MTSIREICGQASIDVICIDETKLDFSYPDSQYHVDGYQFLPFYRDQNKHVGGKIVYIRKKLIAKRFVDTERYTSETICIEITISKKK